MAKEKNRIGKSDAEQSSEMSDAEIDRNLMESFPASDPPSWTLGTDHQGEVKNEKDKSQNSNEAE